jgi:hypothetical protein
VTARPRTPPAPRKLPRARYLVGLEAGFAACALKRGCM